MKIAVEAPRKKITLYSAQDANHSGTPKVTAPDRMFALSVRANIIQHCAQKTPLPQPYVPHVAGNTQRATKDVSYTKTYSKFELKPIAQYTQPQPRLLLPWLILLIPAISPLPRKIHPVPAPEPHPLYTPMLLHTINSLSP
jgi:hypothetical protein